MTEVHVRLGTDGRVVIPAAFRRQTGLQPGASLFVRLDEDRVVVESRRVAVRAAQRMVRERVPEGELLTSDCSKCAVPGTQAAERSRARR